MFQHTRNIILFIRHSVYCLIIVIMLLYSCNAGKHSSKSVESAMQQYDHFILNLDADSIALLFTPDGNLGNIARGRDSIKKFLSSFKNVRVLSQSSSTTSIQINKDTAVQKGAYRQVDIVAEKDTVKVKGEYTATWLWINQKGWHIKEMTTKPSN